MIRPAAIVLLGWAVGAADLPVPPIPPASEPAGQAAPVPNLSVQAPAEAQKPTTRVTVEDFRATPFNVNRGFAPGSRYQSTEDRKMVQTPGLSVRVPLQ